MTKRNITTQVTVRGDIGDVYVRDCYDLGTDEPTTRDMLLCEMLMEFHERLATSERRLTALEAQKGSQPDPNPIEIDNEWMDAPMGEPKYSKATCRGSYVFGTACGHCERCADERKTGGDNIIPPETEPCPECGGTGWYMRVAEHATHPNQCRSCDGTGRRNVVVQPIAPEGE